MERKMYLHAAWLFLLARVVHQSLLRDDTEDDAQWRAYDIDIMVCIFLLGITLLLSYCSGTFSAYSTPMGRHIAIQDTDRP